MYFISGDAAYDSGNVRIQKHTIPDKVHRKHCRAGIYPLYVYAEIELDDLSADNNGYGARCDASRFHFQKILFQTESLMELRQLKYFVKVAETRNFSEAARTLFISQSTLSQQIKQLEEEIGEPLFIRDSRRVRLTDVGEQILPSAKKTLREAESCFDRVYDVRNLKTGTLNIGATYTFSPLLKETVIEFMRLYPEIKLNIFCKSMEELMGMLENQEIDIALSYKPSEHYDSIESHILFDNNLSIIVNDKHELAGRKSMRLSELEKYRLALPAKGLQARNTFEKLISGNNFRFNISLEINEINVLLDLVSSSRIVTVLSQATVRHHAGLRTISLENPDCSMEGSYHFLKGAYRKKAAKEFLRILIETNSYSQSVQMIFD